MTKLNVLLLTRKFPPDVGGVPSYYKNLIKHSKKLHITVLTASSGANGEDERQVEEELCAKVKRLDCIPDRLVSKKSLRWLFSLIRTIYYTIRMIQKEQIDLMVIGQVQMFFLLVMYAAKWLTRCKFVLFFHGEEIPQIPMKSNGLLKFLYLRTPAHICNSRFTASRLRKFTGLDNIDPVIITPGVEDRFFEMPHDGEDQNSKINEDEARKYLLNKFGLGEKRVIHTIARLDKRKGQDMVIEALPLVIERHPDVVYLIGGVGPRLDVLKNLVETKGLYDHMRFLGFVSEEDVVQYHYMAEIFLMTNRILKDGDTEGFGIVFLEANAAGRPVIGGNEGGSVDAIVDGVTGYLVDPRDKHDIAQKICTLLENDNLRRKMGEAGRERAWKEFRWPTLARKFEDSVIELFNKLA